jgi:hypothetical protein
MVEFFRFMTAVMVGLVFLSILVIALLTSLLFPSLLIPVLVVSVVVLGIALALSIKFDINKSLIALTLLIPSLAIAYVGGMAGHVISKWLWNVSNPLAIVFGILIGFGIGYLLVHRVIHMLWKQYKEWDVPSNTVMVLKTASGTEVYHGPTRLYPLFVVFEFPLAKIPLATMNSDFTIEKINTKGFHDMDVSLQVCYKYTIEGKGWGKIMGYPNRRSIFDQIKNDLGGKGMNDAVFWEAAFGHIVQLEAEGILRDIIYEKWESAAEAYKQREQITREIQHDLNETLNKWGVDITEVLIHTIQISEESKKGYQSKERLQKESAMKTKLDADYVSTVHAQTIQKSLEAVGIAVDNIKKSGVNLTLEEISAITRAAIREIANVLQPFEYDGRGDKKSASSHKQQQGVN